MASSESLPLLLLLGLVAACGGSGEGASRCEDEGAGRCNGLAAEVCTSGAWIVQDDCTRFARTCQEQARRSWCEETASTWPAMVEHCAVAEDSGACGQATAALPPFPGDDASRSCAWRVFVESERRQDGRCTFGAEQGLCRLELIGTEGECESRYPLCGGTALLSADHVQLDGVTCVRSNNCGGTCAWQDDGSGQWMLVRGPEECECVCDPDFPL